MTLDAKSANELDLDDDLGMSDCTHRIAVNRAAGKGIPTYLRVRSLSNFLDFYGLSSFEVID